MGFKKNGNGEYDWEDCCDICGNGGHDQIDCPYDLVEMECESAEGVRWLRCGDECKEWFQFGTLPCKGCE